MVIFAHGAIQYLHSIDTQQTKQVESLSVVFNLPSATTPLPYTNLDDQDAHSKAPVLVLTVPAIVTRCLWNGQACERNT